MHNLYGTLKRLLEEYESTSKADKIEKGVSSGSIGLYLFIIGDFEFKRFFPTPRKEKVLSGLLVVYPSRSMSLNRATDGRAIDSSSANKNAYKVSFSQAGIKIEIIDRRLNKIKKEILLFNLHWYYSTSSLTGSSNSFLQIITPESYGGLRLAVHPNDHGHLHIVGEGLKVLTKVEIESLNPIKGYKPLTNKQKKGLRKLLDKYRDKINREYFKQTQQTKMS